MLGFELLNILKALTFQSFIFGTIGENISY